MKPPGGRDISLPDGITIKPYGCKPTKEEQEEKFGLEKDAGFPTKIGRDRGRTHQHFPADDEAAYQVQGVEAGMMADTWGTLPYESKKSGVGHIDPHHQEIIGNSDKTMCRSGWSGIPA